MQTLSVNGAELSTLTLGGGDGTAVAMLHGLVSGNMASWYSAFALPLSRTRRVLLYDQRGHGHSTLSARGFDLDSQAADLDAVLVQHGYAQTPVDLVGHSMGALIALRFALTHPARVQRLVLVDAPMPAAAHVAPSLLGLSSPDELGTYIDAQAQFAGSAGRRREREHRRLSALLFDTTLVEDLLAMTGESETRLGALDLPVLLIYGRRSPCLAAGKQLRRSLPQARLELLDCGHYIPEEAPAPLRRLLEDFLALTADALS